MARTKASVGAKVTSTKSTKARAAAPPPPPSPKTGGGSSGYRSTLAGCNPVCPRETPAWQLPITRFFNQVPSDSAETGAAGGRAAGGSGRRRPVIDSDDDEPMEVEGAAGAAPQKPGMVEATGALPREPGTDDEADAGLDSSSAQLPPLDGESSHKIAEYFPKVHNKESQDIVNKENIERRNSSKRSLDDAEVSNSKKVKVLA